MNYKLLKEVVDLVACFERENGSARYSSDINGFRKWMNEGVSASPSEPEWEGKLNGRSAESIIATQFVHMNHYARSYFRSVIHGTEFSTPEEVIYLIVLRFNAPITKMELIKKNVHDKPVGMQIINRLIAKGWVAQKGSEQDRRSKVISPTEAGIEALDKLMAKVRQATSIVSGELSQQEKLELVGLLNKLNDFHHSIYEMNYDSPELLANAMKKINPN
ncbi:MAG: MarR family transcriptional regulator [Chitinophagaceae bacterium]|nr:MAG: MarR family transcriptional regulator [Chitinophagaceae bacterium]